MFTYIPFLHDLGQYWMIGIFSFNQELSERS
jgi:hypothetical protein